MELEDYLKDLQPNGRVSALLKYEAEIFKMHKLGLSLQQIVDFLAQNGVDSSKANLSRFLRKPRADKAKPVEMPGYLMRPTEKQALDTNAPIRTPGMTDAGWREFQLERTKKLRGK